MISLLLAQTDPPIIDQEVISQGIAFTNRAAAYLGIAVAVYIVMLFLGRMIKRRLGVPLRWSYHFFCLAVALFVPSALPGNDFEAEKHINAAVVLATAFLAISFLRHYFFDRRLTSTSSTIPKFVTQLISSLIVLAALALVLQVFYKLEVPGLLAGAGIASIVLGLALQDTLSNVFSGFAIYFGGQFKRGDWLQIGGYHAEIMEVNWRSTRLCTNDDVYLDVPNNVITKETVVNFTHPSPLHAMRLEIGLEYDAPPTKVKKVLIGAALMAPYVLKTPEPIVYLHEFAASSITYQIKFWMDDHRRYLETMSAIRTNLWYALRRHQISIPYPIQVEMFHESPKSGPDKKLLVREALAKVFFKECLNETQTLRVIERARLIYFGTGEYLIRRGEAGNSMFVLVEGRADVQVEVTGNMRSVASIGPGDCIGEMSLLTGETRSASVIALDDTMVVEIDKTTLAPIISDSPELLEKLSDLLARRRLQNEGALAKAASATHLSQKQQDYSDGFLKKLKSIFEI